MASATVPTVPFPTPIDDTDDDDDDDVPPPAAPVPATSAPAAAPTPAPPAANPTVPGQPAASSAIPGVPSGSANPNASGLGPSGSARVSSGLPTSTGVAGQSGSGNGGGGDGLSTGAQAGIGVGVVLAVLLLAVGAWAFIRRRRRRQQLNRKTSESTYNGGSPDVETARTVPAPGPEVRAYYAGASELGSGRDGEKYYNELSSPVNPQEVHGDREFAAELPGSAVPVRGDMQGEMWSPGPPTYEQTHAPQPEKKSGVRLFDDAPIDARDEPVDYDDRPAMADRKGKM